MLRLEPASQAKVTSILGLADLVPPQLLVIKGRDLAGYICSISTIRAELALLHGLYERGGGSVSMFPHLKPLSDFDNLSPIQIIRNSLAKCPDAIPAVGTAGLPFFSDQFLREALRNEIAAVEQSLVDREWKAATVLGGAALEAILFWSIKAMPTELASLPNKPSDRVEDWKLRQMIDVARQLGLIEESTKKLAELARDTRNLVHPGQVLKSRADCDKATSQTVAAAIEAVVRDIASFSYQHAREL